MEQNLNPFDEFSSLDFIFLDRLNDSMIFLLKKLVFLSFLLFPPLALGKIHIEPYFGYSFTAIDVEQISKNLYAKEQSQLENIEENLKAIGNTSYYHGITPGMRLGYRSLNVAVGVDFTFGFWKSLYKAGLEDFKGSQVLFPVLPGLFASYKLPILFRVYGTLIPQASILVQTQNKSQSCNRSRAMKLGFSYLSLPFLSINLEYMPLFMDGTTNCQSWSHTASIYGNITF